MNRRVSVTVDADVSSFNRALLGASATAKGFAHELESADGRMANLVQTGLALAPALVPLGAVGVPVIAGLANQLGAAAAAAGVTVLAFQGVGDALKALNDYQIDPTDAHLKKLQQTMDALGPAGQIFVRQLQDLRPELQDLQDIAQQGLFPGLDHSIQDLMSLAPEVESIIGTISRTLGRLAEQGAEELQTDRWVEFIQYLDHEAAPTLTAMAQTLGYVVEGLASLMMDLNPLADSFTQGMVGYAKAFRDWADGLDQTEGFQQFVDYIHNNGPQAIETLAALGNALIALVTAAAPVGSALLPVIEALANGLAAIANSNVGPLLITTAAAVGTLGRALAILNAVGLRGENSSFISRAFNVKEMQSLPKTLTSVSAATRELAAAESAAGVAHARYIGALKASSVTAELIPARAASANMVQVTDDLVAANKRQAEAAAKAGEAEKLKAARVRETISGATRAAGVVAGLAFATSDYADRSGLANTATYAMLGTIAGPWGAAVGGAIGLTMDLAGANNDLEQAVRGVNDAMGSGDLDAMTSKLADLDKQIAAFGDKKTLNLSSNPFTSMTDLVSSEMATFNDLFTNSSSEAASARDQIQSNIDDLVGGVNALGQAFGAFKAGHYVDDLDRLAPVLERARPAMEALGISTKDLQHAVQDGSINDLVGQIVDYSRWMDTAAGRTQRIADAMAGLDDQMLSTKQSAADLKTSLDDLLDPNLNLVRATDAWTTALRHLRDDLDKNNKTLKGNSDAAIKNREAINQRVDAMKQLLGAEADAGASSKKLAGDLKSQKKALIDAAEAAGISRGAIVDYLKTLGLTPKLVKTLVQAQTDEALAAVRRIKAELAGIPRSISTTYYVNHVNAINKGGFDPNPDGHAAGGFVPKSGLPYADRYHYMLADGEGVTTNRHGETDRFRDVIAGINAGLTRGQVKGMLANGGFADHHASVGAGGTPSFALVGPVDAAATALGRLAGLGEKELQVRAKLIQQELARAEKDTEAARQHRDAVLDDMAAIRQTIADRLKSDLFARPNELTLQRPDNWNQLTTEQQAAFLQAQYQLNQSMQTNPVDILRQDIANANQSDELFKQLEEAGLHGDALTYAEENADPDQLAALLANPRLLKQYQRLYGQREHAVGRAADTAAFQRFGHELRGARQELAESKAIQHRLELLQKEANKKLEQIRRENKKNSDDNANRTAANLNHAAGRATRRGRR